MSSPNFLSPPLVPGIGQADGAAQAGYLDLTETWVEGSFHFLRQNTLRCCTSDALKSPETVPVGLSWGLLAQPHLQRGTT